MNDYYVKTKDLETLWNLLLDLDLAITITNPDASTVNIPKGINLDIIGTIHKPTGQKFTDVNGFQMDEFQALEGFHANIRGNLTEEQQAALPLIEAPATPYRVWA
jgi:hypothetical protein